MKRIISLILLIFSMHCNISSQWLWKNPTPSGNVLLSITFTDTLTGWATGRYGTILKTRDGGKSWHQQICHSKKWLTSVAFIDSIRGWIAGNDGTLLKTTNGGESWIQLSNVPSNLNYTSICFADTNSGYLIAENGVILKTSNGGREWLTQFNHDNYRISKISIKNSDTAWAVGSKQFDLEYPWWRGTVFKTTNGGTQWDLTMIDTVFEFQSVFFINGNTGWIIGSIRNGGEAVILKTENGGLSYKWFYTGLSIELNSIFFIDEKTGWACGNYGKVLKTTDGGNSWQTINAKSNTNYHDVFTDIFFVNENHGFMSGDSLSASTDKGKTWTTLSKSVNNKTILSIHFPSDKTGWMVGDYGLILKTTDKGEHWSPQDGGLRSFDFLMSVFFVDTLTGYAVGSMETYLLKTTDGGLNWIKKPFGFSAYTYSTYFINADTGWIIGYRGCLMTTDGGDSWIRRSSDERSALFSLKFFNNDLGYAVSNEAVGKTTNGGVHWDILGKDYKFEYTSVFFVDELTGWAAGNGIKKTTDGGVTWELKYSGENVRLNSIYFRDKDIGWAVGALGQIAKTTDGGETWQNDYSDCSKILYAVYETKDGVAWAAGEEGTILQNKSRTITDGSITEAANEPAPLNMKYSLEQNYPNPFNPSTIIEFTNKNYSRVTIKVFDLLGREVASIFDKEVSAGRHKITFNASALPSGTYIYRLQAGNAVAARKMILVK